MRIAIFGSTGLAGAAVARLALEHGHQVRALVRGADHPDRVVTGMDVVRGDALDPDAVARTIDGADAVLSTLGGFRGPESIALGTNHIITAMRERGPRRLVVLQGFHVDFPGDPRNAGRHLIGTYLTLRSRTLVSCGTELGELLRATDDVSWTLVRIPRMVDAGPSGRARAGIFELGPWNSVRSGDVAAHMVTLAENDSSVHYAPMLYTPRSNRTSRSDTRAGVTAS
jgi:putative NADH-flavin reductase